MIYPPKGDKATTILAYDLNHSKDPIIMIFVKNPVIKDGKIINIDGYQPFYDGADITDEEFNRVCDAAEFIMNNSTGKPTRKYIPGYNEEKRKDQDLFYVSFNSKLKNKLKKFSVLGTEDIKAADGALINAYCLSLQEEE